MFLEHVGDAHLVDAGSGRGVESCGRGHHHRFTLVVEVFQTPPTELFRIVHRQLGHRVESSHRYGRVHARYAVESVDETFATLHILVVHITIILLGSIERCFGHDLSDEGRGEARLTEFHHGLAHALVLGDERADAYATLRITFRYGVDEYHILLDAFKVAGRDVGRTGVDVFAVDLIGKQVEVVFLHQVAYLVHLPAGVEIARRVVGVAYHNGPRVLVDEFLKLLHLGQRKALVDGGGDGADARAGTDGKGHIVGVSRFGNDDFVSRVQAAHEGEKHRLTTSRRDDDVVGRDVDVVLLVVAHQLLAVACIAL